jgi:hypothetical protein
MNIFNFVSSYKVARHQTGFKELLVSVIFGTIFIAVGIPFVKSNRIPSGWEKINGEIIEASTRQREGSTLYSPVVEYQIKGEAYRVSGNVSTSWMPKIGDTREVAYNPAMPSQARLTESGATNMIVWIFPLSGGLLILLTLYGFIKSKVRSRQIQELISHGTKITGVLIDIKVPLNRKDNTFQIVVSATDLQGVVQNYVSDPVSGIGALGLADFKSQPIPIDVYLDSGNQKIYYVDVADIPNLTSERIQQLIKNAQTPQTSTPIPGLQS